MKKENIEKLVDKIVSDYFKDELPVYELDKEQLFENAWNQNYAIQETTQFDGINQAANPVEMVLGCISTLFGTIKTIFEINKFLDKNKADSKKDVVMDLVYQKWVAELQLAGLSAEKAQLIGTEFGNDLEKLIKYDK